MVPKRQFQVGNLVLLGKNTKWPLAIAAAEAAPGAGTGHA